MKVSKQKATVIMKAALVALLEYPKSARVRDLSLPRGISTEQIREVFQCLPDFDAQYSEARQIITEAAKVLKRENYHCRSCGSNDVTVGSR